MQQERGKKKKINVSMVTSLFDLEGILGSDLKNQVSKRTRLIPPPPPPYISLQKMTDFSKSRFILRYNVYMAGVCVIHGQPDYDSIP